MLSKATLNRIRRAVEIQGYNLIASSPCDLCYLLGVPCFKMGDSDKLKCAECTRRGKPCVSVSWNSLDSTRDRFCEEISSDEAKRDALIEKSVALAAELAEMQSRISRKRKVLEQA